MTKKIFRSILSAALLVLAVCLALVIWCLTSYYNGVQSQALADELTLAARGVEQGGGSYLEGLTSEEFRLTWVAPDGTVLYDTQVPAEEMENHAGREEIREALAAGEGESERTSATLTRREVYRAVCLSDGSVLRVSADQVTPLALLLWMFQPILLMIILAVVLSAALAHRMARKIAEPLDLLDLDHPLDNDAYEELTPLLTRLSRQNREIDRQLREVERAERARREFTANVSHELKTPIQSILGSAELLENGMVKEGDVPRFAGRIRAESERLVALIGDILRLSELDEGAPMPKEDVDLYDLALGVAAALQPSAAARRVTLTAAGDHAVVNGVRPLLQEMIFNLCDNAVKYNVEGGTAAVTVHREGDGGVTVAVRDTGVGIPREYQDRVFERFFRVDKSRSRESGGTGLGLSIVKHAAQYHGAKVALESTSGAGTAVTVAFPPDEQT